VKKTATFGAPKYIPFTNIALIKVMIPRKPGKTGHVAGSEIKDPFRISVRRHMEII
jgi:hypothetical protein